MVSGTGEKFEVATTITAGVASVVAIVLSAM